MEQKTLEQVMKENIKNVAANAYGTSLVSFAEQRDTNVGIMKENVDVGYTEMNPDGTLARSAYVTAAVNFESFYDNRYRVIGDEEKVLQLVTAQTTDGYRVIREQASGRVFQKLIPVFEFKRKGKEVIFDKLSNVSDTEFVSEFTHKLSAEEMKKLIPLIPVDASVAEDSLPI